MENKRILTLQDISCVGKCSLTVALPVLSACGLETCILPSAVLSTHTGGFVNISFRDLTDDIPAILSSWKDNNITFDGIYTGYLGNKRQIDTVKILKDEFLNPGGLLIVDPAMADNGNLYSGFDSLHVDAMRELCKVADIIIPNLTEACLLTNTEYKEKFDVDEINSIIKKCGNLGPETVIVTGASDEEDFTGAAVYNNNNLSFVKTKKLPGTYHGTGDLFASVFTGKLLSGKSILEAVRIAVDYVSNTIQFSLDNPSPKYGVRFEEYLHTL